MKITVISGSDRGAAAELSRGIADGVLAADKDNLADVWLLPAGITTFCTDCGLCFGGEPNKCRHAREIVPIRKSMQNADTIVFVTPSVSGHAPAVVVNFLNYLEYIQLNHSPLPEMARKRFVVLSLGEKRAAEDVADFVRLWGAEDVKVISHAERAAAEKMLQEGSKKPGFFARWMQRRAAKKAQKSLMHVDKK